MGFWGVEGGACSSQALREGVREALAQAQGVGPARALLLSYYVTVVSSMLGSAFGLNSKAPALSCVAPRAARMVQRTNRSTPLTQM